MKNQNNHQIFSLKKRIFWDTDECAISDLIKTAPEFCIPRIFERGTDEEINNMIDYYGFEEVKDMLKKQLSKRFEEDIERACVMFQLKKSDFECYKNKRFLSLY